MENINHTNYGCEKRRLCNQWLARQKTVSYLSDLFSSFDVKCQSCVHYHGELTVPCSLPAQVPVTGEPGVIGYVTGVVYLWSDCDGCNSERWGIKLHSVYWGRQPAVGFVQKVAKCHELRLGVAITGSSIAQTEAWIMYLHVHTTPTLHKQTRARAHEHARKTNHVK